MRKSIALALALTFGLSFSAYAEEGGAAVQDAPAAAAEKSPAVKRVKRTRIIKRLKEMPRLEDLKQETEKDTEPTKSSAK